MDYLQSRVLGVLIGFQKIMIDQNFWTKRESQIFLVIFDELIRKGQKKGSIKSDYDANELSDFLW